ncbi:MAG: hypothetical protein ACLSA6_14835 [Holdemania massiliensis]
MMGGADVENACEFNQSIECSPIADSCQRIRKDCFNFLNQRYNLQFCDYPSFMDGFTTHLAQIMIKHYFHFEAKITFGGVIINKFSHVSR